MKCPRSECGGDLPLWQRRDLERHCPSPTCKWYRCRKCGARIDPDQLRGFAWPKHDGPSTVFVVGE